MNNIFSNLSPVVKNLLIINIICFIGAVIFEPAGRWFGVYYPDSPFFKIWQPITYMFMHSTSSIGHIFFNMFALVMFGPIIERMFGSKRFLNYYLICALGALVLQYGVQAIEVKQITGSIRASTFLNFDFAQDRVSTSLQLSKEQFNTLISIYGTPMVGASGAIFGLLLAFAYLFPNMPLYFMFIPVPIKAKYFVGAYILIEVYLGFNNSGSSIAHLAHVGGALFGYLLIKTWKIKKGYH
ncbi:rhomboid family intramembrane serine protease [Sphingobacterium faecale]|uniref:Rhomboid family intramembrane serine protease n=1 Tax=Sphingobacterium faecale TaxID=2803775 RepID=A0ABS1R7E9_9SPHI|nr:rhomboid family intramembrane serine protease [Sphingobacterium faecale]MBL1410622.1 rhomboid family intramembrane serine protease [Sphingobacterium faecale]